MRPKIIESIGDIDINVLSKSVGTWAIVNLISKIKINRLILCGLPLNDLSEDEKTIYQKNLAEIDGKKVICFQNEDDSHGSFEEVKEFIGKVNSEIKVIEKPGNTHDYPYFEDFISFLKQN